MLASRLPYQFSRPRDPDDSRIASIKPTSRRVWVRRPRTLSNPVKDLRREIVFRQAVRNLDFNSNTKLGHKKKKRHPSKSQVLTELHKISPTPQKTDSVSLSPRNEEAWEAFRCICEPMPSDDDGAAPCGPTVPHHRRLRRRVTQEAEDGSWNTVREGATSEAVVVSKMEEEKDEVSIEQDSSDDDEKEEQSTSDEEENLEIERWEQHRLASTDDEQVLNRGEARVVWQQGSKLSFRLDEGNEEESTGEVEEAYRILSAGGTLSYVQSHSLASPPTLADDMAPTDHSHTYPETLHHALSTSLLLSPLIYHQGGGSSAPQDEETQDVPAQEDEELWVERQAKRRAPSPGEDDYGEESEGPSQKCEGALLPGRAEAEQPRRSPRRPKRISYWAGNSSDDDDGTDKDYNNADKNDDYTDKDENDYTNKDDNDIDEDDDYTGIDPALLFGEPLSQTQQPYHDQPGAKLPIWWDDIEEWERPEEAESVEETVNFGRRVRSSTPPSPPSPTPSFSRYPETFKSPPQLGTYTIISDAPTTLSVSPLRHGIDGIRLHDNPFCDDPPSPYPYSPNPSLHFWAAIYDVAASGDNQSENEEKPTIHSISTIEDLRAHPSNAREAIVIPQLDPAPPYSTSPRPPSSPDHLPAPCPSTHTTETPNGSRLLTPGPKRGLARKTSDVFEEDDKEKPGMKRGRRGVDQAMVNGG
ncbi:hypothetical protein L202_03010 [Cryptococcus amylolentus CBS 6039]|uniref:Uncharacterized protein n=1 Tax=Cryptococcus amylolentus CBS 6039 TaxID=1295533 RepID=A0A1E3HX42_9TREE|nr:hypothetical protein L202_03010 [Cryptococcus amylolentus CBS 6039]ODN80874.1 hypothetical protein L202_03010 [Cryptococcus amylolentus CBS 6039]